MLATSASGWGMKQQASWAVFLRGVKGDTHSAVAFFVAEIVGREASLSPELYHLGKVAYG